MGNSAIKDDNAIPIAVPPKGIETISADTDLATLNHSAIQSNTDFNIYFGDASGTTYLYPADTPLPIHQTAEVKLSAQGTFLVY